jgi:hypothetical protein
MADDVVIPTGQAIATEDVGGVHHQKMKVEFGDDGVAVLVSASNPLPVADAASKTSTDATTAAVDALAIIAATLAKDATVAKDESVQALLAHLQGYTVAAPLPVKAQVDESTGGLLIKFTLAILSRLQALVSPPWLDPSRGALRVLTDSTGAMATVTTVSSVTNVANITSIGSINAAQLITDNAHAAWLQGPRRCIS